MIHQTAGGVLFNKDLSKIYLINKIERDEWLLPKGHVEEGETAMDAAKREIYEETGYRKFIIIGNTPVCVNEFDIGSGDTKVFRVFAAILLSDEKKDTKEMDAEGLEGNWWEIDKALKLVEYDDIKLSIKKAHEQIRKNS